MVGIYSITSPSGKSYIGQSWDIDNRVRIYKYGKARNQPALNHSFNKYGFDSHEIKVLHELPNDVTQDVLDTYEQFYIDRFRECNIVLLNIREGGSRGKHSIESRAKLSKSSIGKKMSEEARKKMSVAKKGKRISNTENYGKYWRGRKRSLAEVQTRAKMNTGKTRTDESKNRMSESRNEWIKNNKDKVIANMKNATLSNCKPIIQLSKAGEFIKEWPSIIDAANELNIHCTGIGVAARGENKTAKGFKWKYA